MPSNMPQPEIGQMVGFIVTFMLFAADVPEVAAEIWALADNLAWAIQVNGANLPYSMAVEFAYALVKQWLGRPGGLAWSLDLALKAKNQALAVADTAGNLALNAPNLTALVAWIESAFVKSPLRLGWFPFVDVDDVQYGHYMRRIVVDELLAYVGAMPAALVHPIPPPAVPIPAPLQAPVPVPIPPPAPVPAPQPQPAQSMSNQAVWTAANAAIAAIPAGFDFWGPTPPAPVGWKKCAKDQGRWEPLCLFRPHFRTGQLLANCRRNKHDGRA